LLFDALSEHFSQLDERELKRVTGFSGMLGKISYADMNISEEEKERLRSIFRTTLNLDDAKSELLLSILVEHRIQLFTVEDYLYSRLINEVCDFQEKMGLVKAMFSVAAADGSISQEEDAAIFTAAKSIHLSHGNFISLRKQFSQYLEVLRK
jgi:uncharacterized tellurite resistance protein B-like protein